ncbi:MAG: hypothetical protein QOH81_912 [Sphingomonadales bacterium]|jgi:hypothetical protein|nr:hypothetical protein [Sphingomonadales bacterium]
MTGRRHTTLLLAGAALAAEPVSAAPVSIYVNDPNRAQRIARSLDAGTRIRF